MWGIPCDEIMYSKFFFMFERNAYRMPWDDFGYSEGTYLPKARNFIHNKYLHESDAPYLMMLDSDSLISPHVLDRLLAHKKPIVSGWYKDKKAADHHPVVFDFFEENDAEIVWKHRHQPGEGLEKVDGVGAGVLLMSRTVAETLGENPYDMNKSGEDLTLCRRLMKLNIPLYVDWSAFVAHAGVGFY